MGWDKYQNEKGQAKLRAKQRNDSIERKARARAKEAARRHMENQTDKRVASGNTWSAISGGPIGGGGLLGGGYALFGFKPAFLIIASVVAVIAILAYCVIVSRRPSSES